MYEEKKSFRRLNIHYRYLLFQNLPSRFKERITFDGLTGCKQESTIIPLLSVFRFHVCLCLMPFMEHLMFDCRKKN